MIVSVRFDWYNLIIDYLVDHRPRLISLLCIGKGTNMSNLGMFFTLYSSVDSTILSNLGSLRTQFPILFLIMKNLGRCNKVSITLLLGNQSVHIAIIMSMFDLPESDHEPSTATCTILLLDKSVASIQKLVPGEHP